LRGCREQEPAPLRHEVQQVVDGQLDPQLRAPVHHIPGALDRIVGGVLQQRLGAGLPACIQPAQDAHRQLHSRRHHAQLAAANKVVEERLQGLVEDLIGGLARIDVAPTGVVSRPAVELVDVVKAQSGLDISGDRGPVLIDQPTLPAQEKDTLILRVLHEDDAHLRTELLRRVGGQSRAHSQAQTGRTVAELLDAAQHHREDREHQTAKELEHQRVRLQREATATSTRWSAKANTPGSASTSSSTRRRPASTTPRSSCCATCAT
jgi:hypothetical protein